MRDPILGLQEHYNEALNYFDENQIVGIFLQGSQNYEMEIEGSDVDSKLIVVPSFKDIALNKKPISTTHIRENEEHIDFKDVRLYMEAFRKQNINFVEILFTKYKVVNPLYAEEWQRLVDHREEIARMNLFRAVKAMKGVANEKYFALDHPYPSKLAILEKYGYDPKQLHHLLRIRDFMQRYIAGESYQDCLTPKEKDFLLSVKKGESQTPWYHAFGAFYDIEMMEREFCQNRTEQEDPKTLELMRDVQYQIMKTAVEKEFE